jgi:hypothetical protein
MTKIYADAIEPASGTTLTVGSSGNNAVVTGNDIRANVLQDLGGNALFTSNGSGVLSGINSSFGSSLALLDTLNPTATASVQTTGISAATYVEYYIVMTNIIPATNSTHFQFQVTTDGTNFDEPITSGMVRAYRTSSYTGDFGFDGTVCQSNGTAFQSVFEGMANTATGNMNGTLRIWNPGGSRWKSYNAETSSVASSGAIKITQSGGTIATTDTLTGIKFQFSSGNITSGIIQIYGVK